MKRKRRFVAKTRHAHRVVLAAWMRYEEQEAPLHLCDGCKKEQADFAYVWYESVVEEESFEQRFEHTLAEQQERGPVEHSRQYYCAFCAFSIVKSFGNKEALFHLMYATRVLGRGIGGAFYRIANRPAGAVFGMTTHADTLHDVYERRLEAALHGPPIGARIGVKHDHQ